VAHENGTAGTIGAFVRLPDRRVGVLSCSHVLALGGRADVNDHVYQPGEGPIIGDNRVGRLTGAFSSFVKAQHQNLDAAVATLIEGCTAPGTMIPDLEVIPEDQIPKNKRGTPMTSVLSASELQLGERVAKLGRTTGFTTGTVSATNFRNLAVWSEVPRIAKYTFSEVIELTWDDPEDKKHPFSAGGDSGALLFRLDDLRPVGLHFATMSGGEDGEPLSYAIQLDRICAEYRLELI
jgi:hypothetical protein